MFITMAAAVTGDIFYNDDEIKGLQFMNTMSTDEYEFHETAGVKFMNKLPRFGHGSDFSKLASSNHDEQTDYVVGILAVSFFLISIFIFLSLAILTCKCMGKRRVSFFAGGRFRVIQQQSQSSSANNKHKKKKQKKSSSFKPPSYIWQLRCTFMILGCIMILLCVALVGPGLHSITQVSYNTRKLNRNVKDIITQGLLIMDQVNNVKSNLFDDGTIDVQSILRIEESCPNAKNNTFISNKSLRTSIAGIENEFDNLKGYLQQSDFEGVRTHVNYLIDGTDAIETAIITVERNDWMVRMFAMILSVLSFFMIFAACGAFTVSKCLYLPAMGCMLEVFIIPVFILGIVCSWLVTSVLAFASISNADFCTGSSEQSGPAGTVMNIFNERGISSGDMMFDAFVYFQSGCTTDDPITHLYKYEDDLQSGISSATKFLTQADKIGMDEMSEQCGTNVSPTIEGIGVLKDNLGILLEALRSTFELVSCYKISPVYTQIFEGTTCTDSSESLTLIFLILIAMSCVGMIMIMLRSSMYPYKKVYRKSLSVDEEEDGDEWEEYQAYLMYMASFVSMWGDNTDDSDDGKTNAYDTSSESTSNAHLGLGNSSSLSSEEERPSKLDTCKDNDDYEENPDPEHEEKMPLSPTSESDSITAHHSGLYIQTTLGNDIGDDDECMPLSPETPSIHVVSEVRSRKNRFMTPEFLTPGTFRRWRRQDESVTVNREIPQTPLMTSPTDLGSVGITYLSSIISPRTMEKGGEDDGSVKIE